MKKQGISPIILLSSFAVGLVILSLLGYRVYQKIERGATNELWMDIVLMVIAVLLVVRVILMYKRQK